MNTKDGKKSETGFNDSEKLFELLVESATDYAIFSMSTDRRVMTWNKGAQRLMGYREEEIVGRSGDLIFTSEDRAAGAPEQEARTALDDGCSEDNRWHVRKDGSRFFGTGVMTPLRSGETVGFVKVLRDNTKQKQAEKALLESRERLRGVIESIHDYAIFTLDRDGRVTSWNEGARRIKGYSYDEIIGQPLEIFYTPEDVAAGKPRREMKTALRTGRSEDESWRVRRDGTLFWANEIMTPLQDADGRHLGFTKVTRDLSERRRAEEALRESEIKLRRSRDELEIRVEERTQSLLEITESLKQEIRERRAAETQVKELLRQMVSVQEGERRRIAQEIHDRVAQEMTALRLKFESLILKAGALEPEIKKDIEQARRMSEEIDSNLDYFAWELRPSVLDELGIEAALGNLVREWAKQSGIGAEFQAVTPIDGDASEEIEINLYRIAQEALSNVRRHAGADNVSVLLSQRGGFIELIVEDDGIGFNARRAQPADGSDGMGLINIRERAALVGGTLEVESETGKGTTIFVRVPQA